MPESPEVDALAGFLDAAASGRRIEAVDVLEFRVVKTRDTPPATLMGRTITGAARHGKHIELKLGDESLVVSLGRHGWIRWVEGERDAIEADPTLVTLIRENRAFLGRAVRYLAEQGIDQFLDIGAGLPTVGNTHQIAQQENPEAKVVYVDNDPVCNAHGRVLLLEHGPEGVGVHA